MKPRNRVPPSSKESELCVRISLGCTICGRRLMEIGTVRDGWSARPCCHLVTLGFKTIPLCSACLHLLATSDGYQRVAEASR